MLGCSNSAEPPKSLEHHLGRKLTLPESSEAYATLHKAALPFLRKELSYEKYLFKFMHRRKYAKHPLGAKVVLSRAMEKVNTCPPPKEAEQFPDRDIQRLISLCYYLQLETGNKPFFLSSRQAEQLLGGKVSHTTAWQWLKVLEDPYGLIKIVEKGTTNKAPRILWTGKTAERTHCALLKPDDSGGGGK